MCVGLGLFLFCLSTQGQAELVSEWKFDGNAEDSVGNNHGTLNGNPTWAANRFGDSGKALSLDGVDDYVECRKSESLTITDAITIEAWVNLENNVPVDNARIINRFTGGTPGRGYALNLRDNRVPVFEVRTLSGNQRIAGITPIAANGYTCITATFDNAYRRIYINGQLDKELSSNGDRINGGRRNLQLGSAGGWGRYFNGSIDEVRIYNHALSPDEVKACYIKRRPVPIENND